MRSEVRFDFDSDKKDESVNLMLSLVLESKEAGEDDQDDNDDDHQNDDDLEASWVPESGWKPKIHLDWNNSPLLPASCTNHLCHHRCHPRYHIHCHSHRQHHQY